MLIRSFNDDTTYKSINWIVNEPFTDMEVVLSICVIIGTSSSSLSDEKYSFEKDSIWSALSKTVRFGFSGGVGVTDWSEMG